MRLVEKKGPFSAGCSFRVGGASANQFVHVGIQIPNKQPISYAASDDIMPDVQLTTSNGISDFYVNEHGILEFDCNVGTAVTVRILKNLPPETILDFVYKEQGE